jgi:uncharacterized protein (TIGR02271 family)
MAKTITAFFDDFADAADAVRRLEAAGIQHKDISLIANNRDDRYSDQATRSFDGDRTKDNDDRDLVRDDNDNDAGTGAAIGAVAGGAGGLLAGVGLMAIPGIGPVVAAGWLVSTLVGAGAGAVLGGLIGALVDEGVTESDARAYAEGVRRGGALVVVRASDDMVDQIVQILAERGAVDLDQRQTSWRAEGWTGEPATDTRAGAATAIPAAGGAPAAGAGGPAMAEASRPAGGQGRNEEVIPIVEEELQVGKREVSRGRVRIHTRVVERPVQVEVMLREEHVEVERLPASDTARAGAVTGDDAFRERTIEMEERGEEPVVAKAPRVTEEVVVRKGEDRRPAEVSETVRRTEVEVEDERRDSKTGTSDDRK